ncbi:hypothetical protein EXIGLDRAFT_320610 [Exidia glandulosa HHB12029]|uniref:Uncharacterized protein n=1 Tax=Exidia glandulosa HHB12029 TaxID=1314781 RepID=A0A165Q5L4_EXIGL|nr:hypothetical protein EXIGLDRAFT_320610 [Exidia glandulosa HHB12029]
MDHACVSHTCRSGSFTDSQQSTSTSRSRRPSQRTRTRAPRRHGRTGTPPLFIPSPVADVEFLPGANCGGDILAAFGISHGLQCGNYPAGAGSVQVNANSDGCTVSAFAAAGCAGVQIWKTQNANVCATRNQNEMSISINCP